LSQNPTPLLFKDLPEPKSDTGEVLIRVTACGVCHTELDEIEGRIKPRLPIILGHQVVGIILESSGKPLDSRVASASAWHGLHQHAANVTSAKMGRRIFVRSSKPQGGMWTGVMPNT
ncbi:MAG: alcohol dehydrogenase catalytic domain-containing protein, partial [Anaerolineales bacterium]|nr:alcohol dehydrogenase catalytic domain-containing protein [Anaerolineales bacterium]